MNSALKIIHINKVKESDLSKILLDKWKKRQEKELEELKNGTRKPRTK